MSAYPSIRAARRLLVAAVMLTLAVVLPAVADGFDLARLGQGGHVVLLRHARAPGIGDPDDFQIGSCATQRNLDQSGREQARALGERFRSAGINRAEVYSSQWCRCLETAELLELGPVHELPALNSIFRRPAERAPRIAAVQTFLDSLPSDGPVVILVSHQVNIVALTGQSTASGEAIVLRLQPGAEPAFVGTIAPE